LRDFAKLRKSRPNRPVWRWSVCGPRPGRFAKAARIFSERRANRWERAGS